MTTCKDCQSMCVIYPFDVKPFVPEINLFTYSLDIARANIIKVHYEQTCGFPKTFRTKNKVYSPDTDYWITVSYFPTPYILSHLSAACSFRFKKYENIVISIKRNFMKIAEISTQH